MKAPMSVQYLAYLVVGVLNQASWSDGNMDTGFYPGSGPLDGGKTLCPARLILMIWVVQEQIYHEIKEAKPQKLAYGMIVVYGVDCLRTTTLRFIQTPDRVRVTQSRLQWQEILNIRIAKLAFHAKESPIRTRDEVFNLVSSQSRSPAEGIVRLPEHPLIQDSLTIRSWLTYGGWRE